LLSWLRRKYSGTAFDVVVAVGTGTLRFVHEYYNDLFDGAQIVYWGRKAVLDEWESDIPVTGIVSPEMAEQMKPTFAFIRALQPDLKCLAVVVGRSPDDLSWEYAARQELRQFEDRISVAYLSGLSLEEMEERVATLPPKSAILVLTMNE